MATIYADTLVCLNIFVTYFLLLTTQLICRRALHRVRLLAASVLGGMYSLTILLDKIPLPLSMIMRIAACILLCLTADQFRSVRLFLKELSVFLLTNFVFAGLMFALQLLRPNRLLYNTGTVYFDVDIPFLLLSTLTIFILVKGAVRLSGSRYERTPPATVVITLGNKTIRCVGMQDSGHQLRDTFTGKPVLIATSRIAFGLTPASIHGFFRNKTLLNCEIPQEFIGKLRLFPYQAIDAQGLLPAFRCTHVQIKSENKNYFSENIYIAITNKPLFGGEADVLLPQEIYDEMKGERENAVQNDRSESAVISHSSGSFCTVGTLCRHVANASSAAWKKRRSRSSCALDRRR